MSDRDPLTMHRAPANKTEHMQIVIVGHVDHGKSTVLGRLYADTGSLPEGKLEKVQAICRQQGKEFEYAFLFDAFLEEQEQGITIDTARTFFGWQGRQYIILDAPGHSEFLKNMVSGAARAEAALLIIDALEGVKEQSKRHGLLLSLLGIKQVGVVVSKMDLVGYRQDTFDAIEKEFREYLASLNVVPDRVLPVSAKFGDNIVTRSEQMAWYTGPTILETLSRFTNEAPKTDQPLRLPVQDVYKFDARRIIAGRIAAGRSRPSRRSISTHLRPRCRPASPSASRWTSRFSSNAERSHPTNARFRWCPPPCGPTSFGWAADRWSAVGGTSFGWQPVRSPAS